MRDSFGSAMHSPQWRNVPMVVGDRRPGGALRKNRYGKSLRIAVEMYAHRAGIGNRTAAAEQASDESMNNPRGTW